ncbi:MAG TPA: DinB family protein [Gemmatimonadaceae bacterium]|nr:DinB family protein [Gemmatimonadaceae bacterium]
MDRKSELLKEFDQEMRTTRRVLERVPDGKGSWKPHPKSFSLEHLAQLVSWMPGWIGQALRETSLELSGAGQYSSESPATLLAAFDQNVRDTRAAIQAVRDADWEVSWALTHGGRELMRAPRHEIVRQHMSHLVHHRAQLGVYLRLLDVPVPSMYGPTADEQWGGGGAG